MIMQKSMPPLVPPDPIRSRFADVLPPEPAAALELLFTLRETAHRVDASLSTWLGSDALTPGRWQVLVLLWFHDAPVAQREIVRALNVSRATVSDLIETLRAEGQVACAAGTGDRREVLVSLTAGGRALTGRLMRQNAERLRTLFGGLDHAAMLALMRLLRQLTAAP